MRALVKELGALCRRVYTGAEERGLGLKDGVSGLDYGDYLRSFQLLIKTKFADTS